MKRVVILTAGTVVYAAFLHKLNEAGFDAEVIADAEIVRTARDEPHALDVDAALARVKAHAPVKVYQERDFDYHDERRGDPQRDVAMLRREMLARERSNRHMLKKGKGRR
jgi:1-aminocyclopropane-1-carboxylate deaminase/D-cysteine desulfhydrase-like pyridoxal-dependent ACC family enzyme